MGNTRDRSEVFINKFSQLVYLDAQNLDGGTPTVGRLADYYTQDPIGRLYLQKRFAGIAAEYESWQEFLRTGVEDCRSWRITNVLDDNKPNKTGFYGCGYLSEQNELIISFRGSEMLGNKRYENDYKTDFALAYETKTPQQKMVDEYFLRFGELSGRPFTLTGHSLGGNLAVYGAVCAPEKARRNITGCCAFNAPGFNEDFIRENEAPIGIMADKICLYQNYYDVVSSLLIDIVPPRVIASIFVPSEQKPVTIGDMFYPHSNFVFAGNGETFTPQNTDKKDIVCTLAHEFSRQFLALPKILREAVCGLLLDAVYAVQPHEKRIQFALQEATRLLSLWHTADAGGDSLDVTSAAFSAKQMQARQKTAGDIYSSLAVTAAHSPADMANVLLLLLEMMQLRGVRVPVPAGE